MIVSRKKKCKLCGCKLYTEYLENISPKKNYINSKKGLICTQCFLLNNKNLGGYNGRRKKSATK